MEQSDINTLKILKALEENPAQSQRDLSRRLKISLGLVNAFTKRLARKGFFKVTTIPKNRIQYMLTPRGMAEKARLTYQYFSHSMRYYKQARDTYRNLFEVLRNQNKTKVYFLGVSELAEIAYITLLETDLELSGIIDDTKVGTCFLGKSVLSSSELTNLNTNEVVISTSISERLHGALLE